MAFTITHHKSKWKPILIILSILVICLFPLWPYKLKLIVFYISLYSLIFMFIFSIVRLLIWYLFRLAGFEFWIMPEIFNDHITPYYTFSRSDDGNWALLLRLLLLIVSILYVIFLFYVP